MRYSTYEETRFIKFVSKLHKKCLQSVITKIGIFIHGIVTMFKFVPELTLLKLT